MGAHTIPKFIDSYKELAALILVGILLQGCGLPDANEASSITNPSCDQINSKLRQDEVLVGDMILPVSDIHSSSDLLKYWPGKAIIDGEFPIQSLGTTTSTVTLWDDGILPIEFDPEVSIDLRNRIFSACAKISAVADVTCVERTAETYYVRATSSGSGCYATVGRSFGGSLNLQGRCNVEAIIIHELMHNLGVKHEQQHPERDSHVRVIEENVQSGRINNFVKLAAGGVVTGFDFDSIMIYRSGAFSVSASRPALVKKSVTCDAIATTGFPNECLIPFNNNMSVGDNELLATLYGAPGGGPPVVVTPPTPPPVTPMDPEVCSPI